MDSSGDEDFYNDDDGDWAEEGVDDDGDWAEEGVDDHGDWAEEGVDKEDPAASQLHYKVLKQEDIKQLLENDISTVTGVLSVSRGVACTLLCQNNWSLTSVYENWFSVGAASAAGLPDSLRKNVICKICYEKNSPEKMVSTACGHPFCRECWEKYIATAIDDGAGCLTLRCPEPGCKAAVGVLDMVDEGLTSADDREKYYRYLHQSYVEQHRNRKWCPAAGCDRAIEFNGSGGDGDVSCECSNKLCGRCGEESHRPVECKTVAEWLEKNRSEAENTRWILAYTKPCPKCARAIQKNNGCNHMTCGSHCKFQFCWICLKPWKGHDGDSFKCNKFVGREKEETDSVSNAKKYIERYTHFFERWDSNDRSRKMAVDDLNRARSKFCNDRVVTDAWEQIVECRRVLKWSYAFGFYLSVEEKNSAKMGLFECLQGQAEAALERVHHCVEKEMKEVIDIDQDHDEDEYIILNFEGFKGLLSNLFNLTSVARKYFQNLVVALENNLCEVEIDQVESCDEESSKKMKKMKKQKV